MAKDGKFGMFSGVFTPSILTILGVIMYLRLPWIIGNSGLWLGLVVIMVAHVVSLSTGLSVSSIATDKKVGAGGPYYIISRSFGLPIGGAIGLALFLGLSFSISLYVIGFSESFLAYIDVPQTKTNIRLCGTATIVGLTTITFISTSLAIKTQFFILAAIVASLVAVFGAGLRDDLGIAPVSEAMIGPASAAADATEKTESNGFGFAALFGIFFPAVTGFTAGVNMSGDLRDPKSAIPKGTMLAIIAGMLVYLGLGWFLATRVDAAELRDNPSVLQEIALWAPLVVAGIWGATLSSALGSILGAPRILQAMSLDRITPRVFAKGYGPTLEPRNALFLAFAIGEAGILIAELNAIARIVSMVFLSMYGSVNIACAIESWASPDFRPKFRIPNVIPIIGAGACVLLMIQLDVLYSAAAITLMLLAFGALKRRQLSLESGDTWEGVWASLVRVGLKRLHSNKGQQRNWRPNMLMFDEHAHPRHSFIRNFSLTLVTGNGMVTDFALADKKSGPKEPPASDATVGYFERLIATNDRFETIRAMVQHHGFSGIQPNTLLLPWRWHEEASAEYLETLQVAAEQDLNLILFEEAETEQVRTKAKPRIDVWWWNENGNLALSVSLVRFITRAPEWENATVRVLIVGSGTEDEDQVLRAKAVRHMDQSRVDAEVRIIRPPVGSTEHYQLVTDTSKDAALCVVGLPHDLRNTEAHELDHLEHISALPGGVVIIRANKAFPEILGLLPRDERAQRDALDTQEVETVELPIPDHEEVAATAGLIYENLRIQLKRWHDRGIARLYERHVVVCDRLHDMAEARYDAMLKAAAEANPPKRRARANRATSTFLSEGQKLIDELAGTDVSAQAALLSEELAAIMGRDALMPKGTPQLLHITVPRKRFRKHEDDTPELRRWKRRQRWRFFYRRNLPQTIPVGQLTRYYHGELIDSFIEQTVRRFERDSHELAVELGRLLTVADRVAHMHLNRSVTAASSDLDIVEYLESTRSATLTKIDELRHHSAERIIHHRGRVLRRHLKLARMLGGDLCRLDAGPYITRTRKRHKAGIEAMVSLSGAVEPWRERQVQLIARMRLAIGIASFRHQLTVAAMRSLEQLAAGLHSSGRQVCAQLRDALVARREDPASKAALSVPREPSYDGNPVATQLARSIAPMTAELPEVETTLTDETVLRLSQGELGAIESVTISVRSGVQALVESNLITRVETEAARIGELQSHSWIVARDTLRVVETTAREEHAAAAGDEDIDDSIESTMSYSIERLDAEIERLDEFMSTLDQAIGEALENLSEATSVLGLASALAGASHKRQQRRASRVVALARRIRAGTRDLAARLVYRRSVSRAHGATGADQLRALVAEAQGKPAVLAALPRYYQYLFLGALNINEVFFIGRSRELELGAAALEGAADGAGARVLLITGDRTSGKTTLCQQIVSSIKAPAIWVSPPVGGSASAEAFRSALAIAVGGRGTVQQLLGELDDGAVVIIDDLDLWWERRPGGLAAIDEIIALVRGATADVRFVLAGSSQAIGLLDDVRPLSRLAVTRLQCGPLPAEDIKDVVMARHTSTGLRMRLGGTDEDALTEWSLARLFHAHFEYSGGNVGASLRAWVAHIAGIENDRVRIERPVAKPWDGLGDLRPELIAILVELLLHKHASVDKLQRITNMGGGELADGIDELRALGLISEHRRGVLHMTPGAHVPVTAWLGRGNLA